MIRWFRSSTGGRGTPARVWKRRNRSNRKAEFVSANGIWYTRTRLRGASDRSDLVSASCGARACGLVVVQRVARSFSIDQRSGITRVRKCVASKVHGRLPERADATRCRRAHAHMGRSRCRVPCGRGPGAGIVGADRSESARVVHEEICYLKKSVPWYSVHECGNVRKENGIGRCGINTWYTHWNYHGSSFLLNLLLNMRKFLLKG